MLELNPQRSMAHWARSIEAQMATQRAELRARPVERIAERSGAAWQPAEDGAGALSLAFFGQPLQVLVPDYSVRMADGAPAPPMIQALVTSYLRTARGTPRAGEWIAFRELPDGGFYHAAFSGYSGGLLARQLAGDLDGLRRGAEAVGGRRLSALGDAAYEFRALPRLWVAMVYWLGDPDDGFPAQANVLFDRSASDYLITDGLAIIGSQLVRRILAGAGK